MFVIQLLYTLAALAFDLISVLPCAKRVACACTLRAWCCHPPGPKSPGPKFRWQCIT